MSAIFAGQPTQQRLEQRALRHWPVILAIALGVWVLLPFVAPVAMKAGFAGMAKAIYLFYSFQCHQLPQRSFFVFGPQMTYSVQQINIARGSENLDPMLLRQFTGNAQLGYKVAWSDRMVSLYTSFAAGATIYAVLRRKFTPLPVLIFIALLIPIGLDGVSHAVSDFWGIGYGFRDTNEWLRVLTGDVFPMSFYVGDSWGSFNSWMRLISGVLAGVGLAWFLLPRFDKWL